MAQTLYALISDCIVNIDANGAQGTGFFVAPGHILTCAHVIELAKNAGASIQITWKGQTYPASLIASRNVDFPDIALLGVALSGHPCVLLAGGSEPGNRLYTYGYPQEESRGASTTFLSEGWLGQNFDVLRLKAGQSSPGMSGSPLLNEELGSVCGIIESTRDRYSDLGGAAISTQVILKEFPELVDAQKQFHTRDKRWSDALSQSQREKLHLGWLPAPTVTGKLKVFVSYSDKDETFKEDFDDAVIMLRRNNLIDSWSYKDIRGDQEKDLEVQKFLNTADIIVLLVSNSFLASNTLYETEMTRAMERHKAGTARIVPIILRPCEWRDTPFGKLLGLPRNGKPIAMWSNRDEAFYEVARELRRVVEDLTKPLQ